MTEDDGQIEAERGRSATSLSAWLEDLRDSLMFLTRLPIPQRLDGQHRSLAQSARAFPPCGAIVGAVSGLMLLITQGTNLPAMVCASLAVLTGVMVTGALHEDGLADVADGFGASGSKDRKLEIMRDSRIGVYGVLALVFVLLLKVTSIAALLDVLQSIWHAPMILIAVGTLSRTFVTVAMRAMPMARQDGRSVEAGQPSSSDARQALITGLSLGVMLLWLAAGMWPIASVLLAGTLAYFGVKRSAMRHVGGQTGDVLGTVQQLTETVMLIALVVVLT